MELQDFSLDQLRVMTGVVVASPETVVLDESLDHDEPSADSAPAVTLVDRIISEAVHAGATDIHLEPQSDCLVIRYRIDGILRESLKLPGSVSRSVISRMKILSGIDISEHRRPQDGRGTYRNGQQAIDYRASTIPSLWGQKIVIRLLPTSDRMLSLESLGMHPIARSTVEAFLGMSQGLIILTGPTGSGKTTAMYAALQKIDRVQKNIVTLEDPIEYQLPGITQIQVEEKMGLTFARGLRAILRQDPDVILVGEIRDSETARMAVQAAMTGHLVITTLHTNDAPSAVNRLIDMGVEPFLVDASLSLVVAQRLVRVVCRHCRESVIPSDSLLAALQCDREIIDAEVFAGKGCPECAETGYKGRIGVFEIFTPSQDGGRVTLREDAIRKALEGVTSLQEVLRVTQGTAKFRAQAKRLPAPERDDFSPLVVKVHSHPLLESGFEAGVGPPTSN